MSQMVLSFNTEEMLLFSVALSAIVSQAHPHPFLSA
jgi:hypothetical protein